MRIDEKTYRYRKEYNANTYEQIKVDSRKENRLRERIEIASKKHGIKSRQYIIEALEKAVQADGITIDSLPDRAESVKQD